MTSAKVKVGIIGCGAISDTYLSNTKRMFDFIDIVACADLDVARARDRAAQYGIATACSVDELLADPEIRFVINLTTPDGHGPVSLAALRAGKSVFNEKPLAVTRAQGQEMLAVAAEKGLRVGGAPDTFLGGGLQTCRKLLDDGVIGQPVAAVAFFLGRGHESWHPRPEFYYKPGGGPMFDMGPYYLTALVSMLGPVKRVSGSTRITFPERTITSQPLAGTVIKVEVPTHVAGLMEFESGPIGTMVTSFDVNAHNMPRIEIYGSRGTLSVPDPNGFGGPVRVYTIGENEWKEVPLTHGDCTESRGVGMADMAMAMQSGRPHRASGELAFHVLDLMHAFHDSAACGTHIEMRSTCQRPAPFPVGLADGELDR